MEQQVTKVDMNDVIDRLAAKLGQKDREIATLEAGVEAQGAEIARLQAELSKYNPEVAP